MLTGKNVGHVHIKQREENPDVGARAERCEEEATVSAQRVEKISRLETSRRLSPPLSPPGNKQDADLLPDHCGGLRCDLPGEKRERTDKNKLGQNGGEAPAEATPFQPEGRRSTLATLAKAT